MTSSTTTNIHRSSGKGGFTLTNRVLMHVLSGLCCFYAGLMVGVSSKHSSSSSTQCKEESSPVVQKVAISQCPPCPACPLSAEEEQLANQLLSSAGRGRRRKMDTAASNFHKDPAQATFPPTLSNMFVDYGTINRDDFMTHMDIGVPVDETKRGSEDVLILYVNDGALPTSKKAAPDFLEMDPTTALENCETLKVILTQPYSNGQSNKCMAIVPQWESFNIYKYMRVNLKNLNRRSKGGVDSNLPLTFVSRSHSDQNMAQQVPDWRSETLPSFDTLRDYLQAFPQAQSEIRKLLQSANMHTTKDQPLIVQVCNRGQSELLMNFVCTAKARNLDISRLFVFATDQYTLDLCRSLGITLCFANDDIFGKMPENAANHYADTTFAKMMMAKVFVVHLIVTLGYPVLFQDVDLIWFKDPIPFFQTNHLQHDILFQDDGARTPRYAPYSPNSGFYYVRNNERTYFLFNRLLKMGDTINRFKSHQAALVAAMNEMATWIGLKVKVFHWGVDNPFLGGVEFHRKRDIMKAYFKNESKVDPYIFHMSWTENKANKKLYLEQIGEWRVKSKCDSGADCCLVEPNIVCHYRDKPSIVPCKDSPPIDKGRGSFW